MTGQHRAAARLRHVADQDPGPAGILVGLRRQPLDQCDHIGMRPVAIARQPHHLPGVAGQRQGLRAGDAALGIEADHPRRPGCGEDLAAEQLLGADLGIIGMGQRRQRFGVDAALVLRPPGLRAGEGCGDQERHQKAAGVHRITLRDHSTMKGGAGSPSRLLDPRRSLACNAASTRTGAFDRRRPDVTAPVDRPSFYVRITLSIIFRQFVRNRRSFPLELCGHVIAHNRCENRDNCVTTRSAIAQAISISAIFGRLGVWRCAAMAPPSVLKPGVAPRLATALTRK